MKHYTVLCKSITGKHGKILLNGKTYFEAHFAHIEEHLKNNHIKLAEPEKPETPAPTETKQKQ
jgi:hypothetical protein